MLLSIDPGANTGWAIFDGQALVACGRGSPSSEQLQGVTEALLEHPVIYPRGGTRNPNDIVKLAVTTGEIAGILRANRIDVRYVEPRAWKGTIDGDACCRRVWSRLSDVERQGPGAKWRPEERGPVKGGKDHVLDAIGIGLHAVGRWRV